MVFLYVELRHYEYSQLHGVYRESGLRGNDERENGNGNTEMETWKEKIATVLKAVPSYRAGGATAPPEKLASEYNRILFVHSS